MATRASTRRRAPGPRRGIKVPFNFTVAFRRTRETLRSNNYAAAAMFALAEQGHTSVFEQVVACILSIRTLDEVSLPTALALFRAAPTPADLARMSVADIDAVIHACSFHEG